MQSVVVPSLPLGRRAAAYGLLRLALRRLLVGMLVLAAVLFGTHLGLLLTKGMPLADTAAKATSTSLAYAQRLSHGDLGRTLVGSINLLAMPVSQVLRETLVRSLALMALALALATVLGVSVGVVAGVRRHTAWSMPILLASITGVSLPSFLLALLLQVLVLRLTRVAGRTVLPVGGFGWDGHIILPCLVLAARPVAQITRITFVSVSEVLAQDYVATARGKGLRSSLVLWRHVLRNALIPVLTTVGVSLRFALSSLPVVELFFGWPGAGLTLLKAIARGDADLTAGLVLSLAMLFILTNLVLEVLYRLADPRLRQAPTVAPRPWLGSVLDGLAMLAAGAGDALARLPVVGELLRPRPAVTLPPIGVTGAVGQAPPVTARGWSAGHLLRNTPLVLGTLLVAGLAIVYCVGPYLAPHSPYATVRMQYVGGTFLVPPFAPDPTYPFGTDVMGRDVLSLILAGTQQTLTLALAAVAARLLVGSVLGAVAGWTAGSRLDRALLTLVEVFASLPALLLAVTVVLAVGIRRGMVAFVVAMCFVGWGEVMQFVRAQLLSIRPRLYIDGAVATGVRASRILLRHVLPNLLPSLVSLAALEAGSVLMLLGEWGFVGVFIGGGAFAEITVDDPLYHFSDVPEWGSLLSNVRAYARAYPWTAFYPALAFFVAILGFNLFGEGLRRTMVDHGIRLPRLLSRYAVAAAAVVLAAGLWLRDNTGPAAFYRQYARAFSGERALAHAAVLASPEMEGRALGSEGMAAVADYVATQFEAIGLQRGGEDFTYFQTRPRTYAALTEAPSLGIADEGETPVYREDFCEYYAGALTNGSVAAPVRLVLTGALTRKGPPFGGSQSYVALAGLAFGDEVLLALSEDDAARLARVPAAGVLVVSSDAAALRQAHTLSANEERIWSASLTGLATQTRPAMYVSEAIADRILAPTGRTVADLRRAEESLGLDEVATLATGRTVSMSVSTQVGEDESVRNVVGHMPGQSADWDHRLVVVLAQYDQPPASPGGVVFPGANDDASGVAVMLETARVLQETEYEPYKTFLFIAYSGEGLDAGRPMSEPEAAEFLKAKYGFSSAFEVETVVRLRGLGAGDGGGIAVAAGGNQRLAGVFEAAARSMGVRISREREAVDLSTVFEDASLSAGGQEAPNLRLTWAGWQRTSRLPEDTLESLSPERLEQAGRVLALALMMIGSDTSG